MLDRLKQRWAAIRLDRSTLRSEAIAGVPGAIGSVPDGMAASVLVGVNPIHGLYASLIGPIVGGATSSTRLMVVTTTSAAALAAGSALVPVAAEDRTDALFWLTLLAGAVMVVAGLLRLGRYLRFVSFSVMIGFLTGVGVNIVLGQLDEITGAPAEGATAVAKAWSVLTNPSAWDGASILVAVAALGTMWALGHTRVAAYSALLALVVPTVALELFDVAGVARVEDVGEIPTGVPQLYLPRVEVLGLDVVIGALAVAVIVLVQGAGVSESSPNRDGTRSDTNRDFLAQGVANLVCGLFRGQPVGGSVGQTALNVSAGARTRWASIFSGIWMLVILVALTGVVGLVGLPTLAAVLVMAAIGSFRLREIRTVLLVGRISQVVMITTFVATLVLPIAAAVGIGVTLSLLLHLNREAVDLRVVQLVPRADGAFEECPAPDVLPSRAVTVLDVYGSLLSAGARTLQARLPDPTGSEHPVVVLRLRGRSTFSATLLIVVADYAQRLRAVGGRLVLSGLDAPLAGRIERSQPVRMARIVDLVPATPVLGEATQRAVELGHAWLDQALADERGTP